MSVPVLAERLAAALTPYLGAFNSKVMVKTIAQRRLGLAPESLSPEHVSALLEALEPTLCTLVGRAPAEALLNDIRREVA